MPNEYSKELQASVLSRHYASKELNRSLDFPDEIRLSYWVGICLAQQTGFEKLTFQQTAGTLRTAQVRKG